MFGSSFIKLRCKTVSSAWPWELIWVEVQSLRFLLCFLYAKLNDLIFLHTQQRQKKQAVLSGLNEDLFLFPQTLHTLPSQNVTKWQTLIDYWYWNCCAYLYEIKYTVANFEIVVSSDTSKKAQLIYDTAVLMSRQWIVALLWLIFIKPLHSLIMHRSAWPISWMLW